MFYFQEMGVDTVVPNYMGVSCDSDFVLMLHRRYPENASSRYTGLKVMLQTT